MRLYFALSGPKVKRAATARRLLPVCCFEIRRFDRKRGQLERFFLFKAAADNDSRVPISTADAGSGTGGGGGGGGGGGPPASTRPVSVNGVLNAMLPLAPPMPMAARNVPLVRPGAPTLNWYGVLPLNPGETVYSCTSKSAGVVP